MQDPCTCTFTGHRDDLSQSAHCPTQELVESFQRDAAAHQTAPAPPACPMAVNQVLETCKLEGCHLAQVGTAHAALDLRAGALIRARGQLRRHWHLLEGTLRRCARLLDLESCTQATELFLYDNRFMSIWLCTGFACVNQPGPCLLGAGSGDAAMLRA